MLAILGTFLVRSGILESIHAFGASTLGVPFLVLIVVMIGGSIALVASRAESLRSEHRLDSLLSREAAFLLNNLVLVALCFVVFWGTFFPLISEAVTGTEASVGPPWFNRYITPLALVLVLLSGIGPLIAWRRATAANLRRNFAFPVGAAVVTLLTCVARRRDRERGRAADVLVRGVRARRGRDRSSGAACGRAGRWRASRCRARSSRASAATAAATAATWSTRASRCCSSASPPRRPSRSSGSCSCGPGQTERVGGYAITYVKPTSRVVPAPNGRLERIDLGARAAGPPRRWDSRRR